MTQSDIVDNSERLQLKRAYSAYVLPEAVLTVEVARPVDFRVESVTVEISVICRAEPCIFRDVRVPLPVLRSIASTECWRCVI